MWMEYFHLGKQRHWISRYCNASPRSTTVHAMLPDALVATNLAYFQPGKSASLSLFAHPGVTMHEVAHTAERLARQWDDAFLVETGATCVNVMVRGLDKAEGVRWLARETAIP